MQNAAVLLLFDALFYTHSHSYSHTASQEHIMFNHCVHHGHKCCLISREMHEFILSSEDSLVELMQ